MSSLFYFVDLDMTNTKQNWNIKNSYQRLPSKFFSRQLPEKSPNPTKIYFNHNLALDLGLGDLTDSDIVDYFSGNKIPEMADPIAQAYAGHQFGYFTMLGDGRAILIGEQLAPNQQRYDIQLKGSGQTPYSRHGDGKATLISVLREYLISEAMHQLGVPTTRSLAVVQTGQKIYRERMHDGALLTRVSKSHIRCGTFEFAKNFCSKHDLEIFVKYVINRHYPQALDTKYPIIELFETVMNRQIDLIINWMRVGFIHGVMNTDNMSISGETIDYGPCAFMNSYDPDTVFSFIDKNKRYSFGNQPKILYWNLSIFAKTLIPVILINEEKSIELLKEKLNNFSSIFLNKWYMMMSKKIGIINPKRKDKELVDLLLKLMRKYKADYTNTFAALSSNRENNDILFSSEEFSEWRKKWEERTSFDKKRADMLDFMQVQNPLYIPRNHLVEFALEDASKKDFSKLNNLMNIVTNPYSYTSNFRFQDIPKGFDSAYKTFCGT